MVDQDRLAAIMDAVAAQHYAYITEGQMAPRWWAGMDAGKGVIYRKYNISDKPGEKPYIGFAIRIYPSDYDIGEDAFKERIVGDVASIGPMPSKAEWEGRRLIPYET
jgi:hypothetical protein